MSPLLNGTQNRLHWTDYFFDVKSTAYNGFYY